MARFLDSSVFLHAYLRPKRRLRDAERKVKQRASAIIGNIEKGEEVVISTIHLSEVLNIMEARLGLEKAVQFLEDVLATENIKVEGVGRGDYDEALVMSSRYKVSPNDAVACVVSKRMNISEVYSFDKHFDRIPFIKRLY
jgi:predicted nucleic acid-binding protein